eukprot:COSAG05_NODE_336_length_11205_cov_4.160544_6_plen_266_part_00
MGIFDQDVREETVLANPKVYRVGQEKMDLNMGKVTKMLLNSMWHASVIYAVPAGLFWGTTITDPKGRSDGIYIFGTAINACLMLVVTAKAMLMTRNWTSYNVVSYVFSAGIWFGFVAAYSHMLFISSRFYGLVDHLYDCPTFWLALPVAVVIAILPDFIAMYMQFNYFPKPWDQLRKLEQQHGGDASSAAEVELDALIPRKAPGGLAEAGYGGSMSEASGYDFSMAEIEHKPVAASRRRRPTTTQEGGEGAAQAQEEAEGIMIRL